MSKPDKLRIKLHGDVNKAILAELIDEFLPPSEYEIVPDDGFMEDDLIHINKAFSNDTNSVKREIYGKLAEATGYEPEWGILTGVRPVKLAGEMIMKSGEAETRKVLEDDYYLSKEKIDLIVDMYNYQYKNYGNPAENSLGIYIGIPFCPTRCLYCSFASNQVEPEEIARYMNPLIKEIKYCGDKMASLGLTAETVYIGGGTPTTLDVFQLNDMLQAVDRYIPKTGLKEFTVEAGRPDTLNMEKLSVLKDYGVDRISINPQSLKQDTLDLIGRKHTVEQTECAFDMAANAGFHTINCDLIAGLPGETPDDFKKSLDGVISMGASNVTVHTLAVKRASRLMELDSEYHYKAADAVDEMLKYSRSKLAAEGFVPYYLYRQKHMAGANDNTGYAVPGHEGLYNIRIMDEHQSILAIGAGGISKLYTSETNKLERVPNVTNYSQYIDRIDEMIERKEINFFRR